MKGLTILELALAMAITSVIFVTIGGMFQGSSEGLEYFAQSAQSETMLSRTLNRISADLHRAHPPGEPNLQITRQCQNDKLVFDISTSAAATSQVTYEVDSNGSLLRSAGNGQGQTVATGVTTPDGFTVTPVGAGDSIAELYEITLEVQTGYEQGGNPETKEFSTTITVGR